MPFIPRTQWGAPALRGDALRTTDKSNRRGFVVHWDGGRNPEDAADEVALMRAYHRHHDFLPRGGFPYNLAVGPITGNVYEGRGLDRIGAHAGGANTRNIGVILIGGPGNLTDAAKRGLKEAFAIANEYADRILAQRVHSDVNSTDCPGDALRDFVRAGGLTGGVVPTEPAGRPTGLTPPPFPLPPGSYFGPEGWGRQSVSGHHGGREHLRVWQQQMKNRGWHIDVDGLYSYKGERKPSGSQTGRVAGWFQAEKGLRFDRLIGPETWAAAWTAPIT